MRSFEARDLATLRKLDNVWRTLFEIGNRADLPSLVRLRRRGLVTYRVSDGHGAGEWATTAEGDSLLAQGDNREEKPNAHQRD